MGLLGLGGSAVVSTQILHLELRLSLINFWFLQKKMFEFILHICVGIW